MNLARCTTLLRGMLLGVGLVALGSGQAAAWHWTDNTDQLCNPDSGSDIATLPPPRAMLMLDRSGSMASTIPAGQSCNRCSYQATVNGDFCRFQGEYCEEDGWFNPDDWRYIDVMFGPLSAGSTSDCNNRRYSLLRDYVDDHHGDEDEYCGARNDSMTYYDGYSVSGAFGCDLCTTDTQCQSRANQNLSNHYSDFTINSANYYQSGSCNTTYDSLWNVAVSAIDLVTADMTASDPDTVEFGLGTWEGWQANIHHEAGPNMHGSIMQTLNNTGPAGGTPTSLAIHTMMNSSTVSNAPGGSAGVLITDGEPTSGLFNDGEYYNTSARTEAVMKACEHRDVAPLYVVGFGSGADQEFNDIVAAAGGTGSCTGWDPCTNPRDWNSYYGSCDGAYQANDPAALKVALSGIANEISCTFSLSAFAEPSGPQPWDEQWQGCESSDYDCIKIELGGSSRIFHIDSPRGNRGWEFATPSHTSIRLLNTDEGASDDYCQMARDGLINNPTGKDVSIQLACLCREQPNSVCGLSDMEPTPEMCECPVGRWRCNQGNDVCRAENNCPIDLIGEGDSCTVGVGECQRTGSWYCPANGGPRACSASPGDPEPEICDGLDNDCGGEADELDTADDNTAGGLVRYGDVCHIDYVNNPGSAELAAIDAETRRCSIGVRGCSAGSYTCEPLAPMPEVCNGLDDDCDNAGRIDNLNSSWNRPEFDAYTLSTETAGAACYERNVCSCPNGPDNIEGDDFTSFIEGWTNRSSSTEPIDPSCVCGEGVIE